MFVCMVLVLNVVCHGGLYRDLHEYVEKYENVEIKDSIMAPKGKTTFNNYRDSLDLPISVHDKKF